MFEIGLIAILLRHTIRVFTIILEVSSDHNYYKNNYNIHPFDVFYASHRQTADR